MFSGCLKPLRQPETQSDNSNLKGVPMPIPAKLKKRWDIYPTLEYVLSATQNLSASPFGTTENGLLDFRGIKLESGLDKNYAQTYELPVSLHRADFSGSTWTCFTISSTMDDDEICNITDCVFDESKFHNGLAYRVENIRNCSFHACVFKYCVYFNTIENCTFTGMKKSNTKLRFLCDSIKNCLFEGEMRKINFGGSPLENCTFKGTLYDCSFEGLNINSDKWKQGYVSPDEVDNRFNHLDCTEAEFIMCTFHSFCYLDRVKPLPNNCLVHITDELFAELNRLIASQADADLKGRLLDWARSFYRPHIQTPYKFAHSDDFIRSNKPETILFARQLYDFVCQAAEATGCRVR